MYSMTKHAEHRSQARGIPPLIIDWLFTYGEEICDHGCEILFFDRRSKKELRKVAGRQILAKLDKYMNSYLVKEGSLVITVGHRTKPIRAN